MRPSVSHHRPRHVNARIQDIKLSDRVAETCEARDRGRTCGSLPLLF